MDFIQKLKKKYKGDDINIRKGDKGRSNFVCMDALRVSAEIGEKMKINRNMSAVFTNNQLKRTENRLSASMKRLSSGFKLNSAGDNPAGMAISNKMKAQIDALDQAETNASNAISTLQIADGALNEVSSMLQRMRELAVQSANGLNSEDDRESIQLEVDRLKEEVDRISSSTEYNTKTLLDGTSDVRIYGNHISRAYVSDAVITGDYSLLINDTAQKASVVMNINNMVLNGDKGTIDINGCVMEIEGGITPDQFLAQLRDTAEKAGCDVDVDELGQISLISVGYGSSEEIELAVSDNITGLIDIDPDHYDEDTKENKYILAGEDADVVFTNPSTFTATASISADGNRVKVTDRNGFTMDFLVDADTESDTQIDIEVTDIGPMTIQIGANQYQTMEIRIPEISTESLYLDTVDVTSEKGADKALDTMDGAIARLNEVRSRIGASQNRLEYASSSLAESEEDMTSAYSNLLDTNMAEEMSEYTQQNVLDQASISVLAQANDIPDKILSLLS